MSYDLPGMRTTFEEIYLEKDPASGVYVVVDRPRRMPIPWLIPITTRESIAADVEAMFRADGRLPPVPFSPPTPPRRRVAPTWWTRLLRDDGGPLIWLLFIVAVAFWVALFMLEDI